MDSDRSPDVGTHGLSDYTSIRIRAGFLKARKCSNRDIRPVTLRDQAYQTLWDNICDAALFILHQHHGR